MKRFVEIFCAFDRMAKALLALACSLFGGGALAHAASTAYLDIGMPQANEVAVQWVVPLRDLDAVLDLDANADGQLAWSEVTARRRDIEALMLDQVQLSTGAHPCMLAIAPLRFADLESGGYAALQARAQCPDAIDRVRLDYRFLEHLDATHRVLLTTPGTRTPRPLAPGQRAQLDLRSAPSRFGALLGNGIAHILGGADHLLFLVALLLPAVVMRTAGRWAARTDLNAALLEVVWIATAFTVAHSITLGLASFHIVSIPGRIIEPLIAVTVLLAALNNLWPVVTRRLAAVAFSFGLVHGFGFAEVLAPLALPARELALALFGFNLGVEIGQLAIITSAFMLLVLARQWQGYGRWVLGAGSALLALTAGIWIVERVFNVPVFALAVAGA
ncbi:MAG TPA: HupE/UreJ family protein [Burkholderiaceae bacterium]|nr:HupE/UreJ family protein [Burkholderiaceae bacterium]